MKKKEIIKNIIIAFLYKRGVSEDFEWRGDRLLVSLRAMVPAMEDIVKERKTKRRQKKTATLS